MHVPLWSWCCLFAQLGEELELEAVGRMLVVELFAMACCDDWGGERQSRNPNMQRRCRGRAFIALPPNTYKSSNSAALLVFTS
jgi:hypothetical protein